MKNNVKRHPLSPFAYRAKTLLFVLTGLLIIANLYLLSATRDLARSYTDQQSEATWFMFQLNKEFAELVSAIPYSLQSEQQMQHTLLQYELAWSRFDLLLSSPEAGNFMSIEGTTDFFTAMFNNFQALETKLIHLKTAQDATELTAEFKNLYISMLHYVNQNFRLSSPLYEHQRAQANALAQTQYMLMALLFCCVGLVSYILHKETQYHKDLALTDALTGIPNRLSMFKALKKETSSGPFCLYLLDLNGFKAVNDTYGHQTGDDVLKRISHRLRMQQTLLGFEVFRMGGDEFAIISPAIDETEQTLSAIYSCFEKPVTVGRMSRVKLSTSVGFACFPDDSKDINQLVSVADKSMYEMKFSGTRH